MSGVDDRDRLGPEGAELEADAQRVYDLFVAAIDLPPPARAAFVADACGGAPELAAEVEGLLAAHEGAGGFLSGSGAGLVDVAPPAHGADLSHLDPRYEVLGHIAAGGMGLVYKVRHRALDRVMALKVIRTELQGSASLRRRFLREARLQTRLVHPNVTRVHDLLVDGAGNAVLVMEYLEGWNLRDVLRHAGRVPLPLALAIAIPSLRALRYLHQQGLVHRDVSPDNFMLLRDETGAPTVKLIDLGIAKPLQGEGSLTQAGLFLGKVLYSSPEAFAAEGARRIDGRSDLYAFAIILYELLTGHVPITGSDHRSTISGHLLHPPRPFRETDPGGLVPDELRAVVLRMLAKRPEDRFPDADAPLEALVDLARRHGPPPAGWDGILEGLRPGASLPTEGFGEPLVILTAKAVPAAPFTSVPLPPPGKSALRWAVALTALLAALGLALAVRGTVGSAGTAPAVTGTAPRAGLGEDPRGESRTALVADAAAVEPGFLQIDVRPWGRVASVRREESAADAPGAGVLTPCRLELPPGVYRVRVESERYAAIEETVRIEPAGTATLDRAFAGFDVDALVARVSP